MKGQYQWLVYFLPLLDVVFLAHFSEITLHRFVGCIEKILTSGEIGDRKFLITPLAFKLKH